MKILWVLLFAAGACGQPDDQNCSIYAHNTTMRAAPCRVAKDPLTLSCPVVQLPYCYSAGSCPIGSDWTVLQCFRITKAGSNAMPDVDCFYGPFNAKCTAVDSETFSLSFTQTFGGIDGVVAATSLDMKGSNEEAAGEFAACEFRACK